MSPAAIPSMRMLKKRCTDSGSLETSGVEASSIGLPFRYLGRT